MCFFRCCSLPLFFFLTSTNCLHYWKVGGGSILSRARCEGETPVASGYLCSDTRPLPTNSLAVSVKGRKRRGYAADLWGTVPSGLNSSHLPHFSNSSPSHAGKSGSHCERVWTRSSLTSGTYYETKTSSNTRFNQ